MAKRNWQNLFGCGLARLRLSGQHEFLAQHMNPEWHHLSPEGRTSPWRSCGCIAVFHRPSTKQVMSTQPGRLTVAVVDDSGRLLEFCEINDDPAGYAAVTALLAERFGGSTMIMLAVDSDDHLVISLLAASARPIAYTDDDTADDFADRFADDESLDELQAAPAANGARSGWPAPCRPAPCPPPSAPTPREFAASSRSSPRTRALAVGRHAAAVALREVLRELYPAALRAYPDPAEPVALAMLDALPEPGLLGRGRRPWPRHRRDRGRPARRRRRVRQRHRAGGRHRAARGDRRDPAPQRRASS